MVEADYTEKSIRVYMYVFEWVLEIMYAYVLEAGRRDEAEVGGGGGGCQGMIVQEREARLNRGPR